MHGGVKVYRGSAAAARNYVEADRGRADDYYLAEGSGVARRFTAGPDRPVAELAGLTGDGYEAWVAGLDPESGVARGRLRSDGSAVRFVEVVVNGPKSWSLAAELHPDVAAAYERAQDRAAEQIVGWLASHATTRVGPRGAQVAVSVQRLEAVTVRHFTSRAGDPHRHLHLQVNARVFAAGKWRGIDTVAVRDSLAAINGIGHAAVACDPEFRAALAGHGYTLTEDGEIAELAAFVGPFSKRAGQIAAQLDRYEADWRREHPQQEPGPRLRRSWDARAWAEDRPDKIVPRSGDEVRRRWLEELAALGYRDRDTPTQLALELPGRVDRDAAADQVIARIGATRSAWNAADLRGEVELLLARALLVAEPAACSELAEDVTARAAARCVPLHHGGAPDHVRALTSQHVLDVEADLATRLSARATGPLDTAELPVALPATSQWAGLDAGQRAAVTALAGDAALVVVQGAAGAGKTTTLAATHAALAERGRRLVVVTPTLKAAQAARAEVGARAGSAASLARQHGWRWDSTGTWTRSPASPAGEAVLRRGDLLLVDEAGMLDQDTARALVTIADETGARLALLGDRHQLPAVGRGGVLELAERWADAAARVDLSKVHRFLHTDAEGRTVPDEQYARLSLAMRDGGDPAAVFDELQARGHIIVHGSEVERRDALADQVAVRRAEGVTAAVVADTREQAAVLNAAIRDRLVAHRAVDDERVAAAAEGQRVGAGDLVVTRRNHAGLGVANREAWTVRRVHSDGRLTLTDPERGQRQLPPEYVRAFVELGYAVTGYGAQGDTTNEAHLLLSDATTAAAAYVAMTRGRDANTAHLVAGDLDDAREQWVAAFSRDRADLGPAAAGAAAARAAAGYTTARPLSEVLADLRVAWDQRAEAEHQLAHHRPLLQAAQQAQPRVAAQADAEQQARSADQQARQQVTDAAARLAELDQDIDREADRIADQLRAAWDRDRPGAQSDARRVQAGTGRFGRGRHDVAAATTRLEQWADRWQPMVGDLRAHWAGVAGFAAAHPANDHIDPAIHDYAHRQAAAAQQAEHAAREHAVTAAEQHAHEALQHRREVTRQGLDNAGEHDHLATPEAIARTTELVQAAEAQLTNADARLSRLRRESALTSHPDPGAWLTTQHNAWRRDRDRKQREAADTPAPTASTLPRLARVPRLEQWHPPTPHIEHGPSIGH